MSGLKNTQAGGRSKPEEKINLRQMAPRTGKTNVDTEAVVHVQGAQQV